MFVAMYWSGVTQGLMWKQFTEEGFMKYPNFLETVNQLIPMYRMRAIGGTLYIVGVFIMAWNLWKTAKSGKFAPDTEAQAAPLDSRPKAEGERQVVKWYPMSRISTGSSSSARSNSATRVLLHPAGAPGMR